MMSKRESERETVGERALSMEGLAAFGQPANRRGSARSRRYPALLLILTTLGPYYSDVLLVRVAGFPVTLVHLLLALTTLSILLHARRIETRLLPIVCAMLFLELVHALFFGLAPEMAWMQSMVQFGLYLLAFLVLAGLRLNRQDLSGINASVRKTAVLFSGIGIIQFVLLNLGISALLPAPIRVGNYNPFEELRTGGFTPAIGLATEPSYYAIGLVALLAYVFFLENVNDIHGRRASWFPVGLLLGGIAVSFSMTGIIAAAVLVSAQIMFSRTVKIGYVVIAGAAILILVANGVAGPIQARLGKVVRGSDNSALIRTVAPIRLLVNVPDDLEILLLGTGLGMEERNAEEYYQIYEDVSLRDIDSPGIKIHNILSANRYFVGWLGMLLYLALLARLTRFTSGYWREYLILLVFLVLFQFASGLFLYPSTWATLALLAVFRAAQLSDMLHTIGGRRYRPMMLQFERQQAKHRSASRALRS